MHFIDTFMHSTYLALTRLGSYRHAQDTSHAPRTSHVMKKQPRLDSKYDRESLDRKCSSSRAFLEGCFCHLREAPSSAALMWGQPAADMSCHRKRFGKTVMGKSASVDEERGFLSPASLVLYTPNGMKARSRKVCPFTTLGRLHILASLDLYLQCHWPDLSPSLLHSEPSVSDGSALWKHYKFPTIFKAQCCRRKTY